MVVVSGKMWQSKQQSVVALLFLTELCLRNTVFVAPSSDTSSASGTNTEGSTALQIIAIIPTMIGPGDPQWTIGEEILPGAQLAIKEINDIPNLLSGY